MSSKGRVAGRVAVVTGAASGIGRATALLLAEEGASLVCVDITQDAVEATAEEIVAGGGRAIAVRADVSTQVDTEAMIAAAIDAYGRVDVLHNNAGIAGVYGRVHEFPVEAWDRVIAVNLRSVFLGSRAAIPHMLEQDSGVIINTCSMFGSFASREFPAYHAAKGGILTLTKQMALDYGPQIRVNCISPGTIETGALRQAINSFPDPIAREEKYKRSNPVTNRLGDPREIAYGVLFLASEESAFMVGHDLQMSGGQGLMSSPEL